MNIVCQEKAGSDNVFKDLGYPNPEERLAKSELTRKINNIIQERKLTQTQAAKILGIPQPKVSLLSKGIVSGFSLGKLVALLNKLDQDVDIVVHEKKYNAKKTNPHIHHGHLQVIYA
jgi:predicted XRE-type DNA-binding protein